MKFNTSFYLDAILKRDITELKDRLNEPKYIMRVQDDNLLRYAILDGAGTHKGFIEFANDHICLRFFFEKQDPLQYKNNLLMLISLIVFLKDIYEVKLDNIYGYITEALVQNWENIIKDQSKSIEELKERVDILNESNCSLSYRLIALSRENKKASMDSALYKEFSKNILDKSKSISSGKIAKNHITLTPMSIDLEIIKRVEESLNHNELI